MKTIASQENVEGILPIAIMKTVYSAAVLSIFLCSRNRGCASTTNAGRALPSF